MAVAVAASAADAVSARLRVGVFAFVYAIASATSTEAQIPSVRQPELLMSEGHELYDAGRFKEAAASFERAMQLGVERPHEAALSVARSYLQMGNRKQALRWGEIAMQLTSLDGKDVGEAARALPPPLRALVGEARISPLEDVLWRTRPKRTPTVKSRSSGSSMTFTT